MNMLSQAEQSREGASRSGWVSSYCPVWNSRIGVDTWVPFLFGRFECPIINAFWIALPRHEARAGSCRWSCALIPSHCCTGVATGGVATLSRR